VLTGKIKCNCYELGAFSNAPVMASIPLENWGLFWTQSFLIELYGW